MIQDYDNDSESSINTPMGIEFQDPDGWFPQKASYQMNSEDSFIIGDCKELEEDECQQGPQTASSQKQKKIEALTPKSQIMIETLYHQNTDKTNQKLEIFDLQELSSHPFSENNEEPELEESEQIENVEILNYNKRLIKKTKGHKIKGKNRYPDIFLPRFKWKIKRAIEKKYPGKKIKMKDLNKLPGLSQPSMKNMIKLLESKDLMSSGIVASILAEQYTSSNQILLDAIFPLETRSGSLRKAKIETESTNDFNRFFTSYEIISKLIGCQGIDNSTLNFQNCRYYHLVTNTEYAEFESNS